MATWISFVAVIIGSILTGMSTIWQKLGADRAQRARSIHLGFLWKLLHDRDYLFGIISDIGAGVLLVVALHRLPLFLVQSIMAASVVFVYIAESRMSKWTDHRRVYPTLATVLGGLLFLSLAAVPGQAEPANGYTNLALSVVFIALVIISIPVAKSEKRSSAIWLSVLSGIALGCTAICARLLTYDPPFWHVLINPILWGYIGFGTLGITLFTMGLQRSSATTISTVMIATETILPSIVGALWLGDHVRGGVWWLVAGIGLVLTLVGTAKLSQHSHS